MTGPLVLIVEDDERNRRLVRDVLTANGYRTLESGTGEEGVRVAVERRPDLVIMDYRLPGIDGVAALAELRADPRTRDIPAVVITASAMTAERERMLDAGFLAYHPKPVKVRELLSLVAAALGSGRGED